MLMPVPTSRLTFEALRDIARALSSARDLDTTLDLIVRKTTELMDVDSCSLYLRDPERDILRLRASTGLSRRALGRSFLRLGEGLTGLAAAENRPVAVADAQKHPGFKRINEAEEDAFHSLLAVPLVLDDAAIGSINVQTLTRREFDEAAIELLQLIADLAAGALTKTRLLESQSRQIGELKALARASEAVNSPEYMDEILDVVNEMAAQHMNAALCSVFLVNEAGTHLELRSVRQATSLYRQRPPIPVRAGVLGEVFRSGRRRQILDVRQDPDYLLPEMARDEGLVSLLAVPLRVRDRVIGVCCCYTAAAYEFSSEQRAWFQTLANQTALAIENARLVANAAVVREMHHRIKNNLQTVAMLMQLQLAEVTTEEAAEVLSANIHRVHSIAAVHEVLSEQGFRMVDVRDVLERIIKVTTEMMALPAREITIEITGESLSLPSRLATSLVLAVNELVQNALEHAFAGRTEGHILVSLGQNSDELIVLVRDNGAGLPEPLRKGLGLEIVDTLVREDLRGGIKYHRLAPGSEFSLRLPRLTPWYGVADGAPAGQTTPAA